MANLIEDMKRLEERMAFSIPEFCFRNNISIPTYYKLRAQGRGPKEMRLGSAVRISRDEEAAWQHARSNPGEAEQNLIAGEMAMLKRRSEAALSRASHVVEARREA